ncbi:hypothetical protein PF005_g27109 [Phytophthora fragariae]|uniref:Uncharacterized protein n=1 Tax=Phytophthora fragariae TaxID=53985 RepID=A0A6A3VQB1_9STRA|nr:hypothetical protein PF005_g27109 [Phytophthora fragariae]
MQEIKPTATETTSIYHTCMSCITQANATDKQLVGIKRFNCSAICPQEIHNTTAWSSPTRYSITTWSVGEVESNSTSTSSSSGSRASGQRGVGCVPLCAVTALQSSTAFATENNLAQTTAVTHDTWSSFSWRAEHAARAPVLGALMLRRLCRRGTTDPDSPPPRLKSAS